MIKEVHRFNDEYCIFIKIHDIDVSICPESYKIYPRKEFGGDGLIFVNSNYFPMHAEEGDFIQINFECLS